MINGVSPLLEPNPEAKLLHYMGHHIYRDINVPIKYTGKIIAVGGFITDYIGVDHVRSFAKVVEWTLENGQFKSTIDLSDVVAEFRTELQCEIAKKNVNNTFSCADPHRFKSLSSMHDAWWAHLV